MINKLVLGNNGQENGFMDDKCTLYLDIVEIIYDASLLTLRV